jgi:hypothetical protein
MRLNMRFCRSGVVHVDAKMQSTEVGSSARCAARRWPALAMPATRHFSWPVEKSARLRIRGALTAILILPAGEANEHRPQDELEAMRMACLAQVEAASPWCDPMVLFRTNNPRHPDRGIQRRIADLQGAVWYEHEWFIRIAVVVLALSAPPFACSFLLSRIRQLRAGRTGRQGSNPPERHSAG